jgi:hypothetical protein
VKAEREERGVRYRQGVEDRADERKRKKWVKEMRVLQGRGNPVHIPPEKLMPIRDREKEPSAEEIEAFRLKNAALFDTIANEEEHLTQLRAMDLIEFSEVVIKPELLALQEEFRASRNPLSRTRIAVDEEDEEESYIPSSPLGRVILSVDENREEEDGDDTMDIISFPPLRSVATIDSFEGRNQNYIRFS